MRSTKPVTGSMNTRRARRFQSNFSVSSGTASGIKAEPDIFRAHAARHPFHVLDVHCSVGVGAV